MKTPNHKLLEKHMLAVEMATDTGLRKKFDHHSCRHLATCLSGLMELVLEKHEDPPIVIENEEAVVSKVLKMIDLAYCCWRNDDFEIAIPDDVLINHIARMKLNTVHCKLVLDFTRVFLNKFDRLLSVESASLRIPGAGF